ncbi:MAG: hypothetical protein H0X39_18605 [Actinobacteria bacterium]|nr:hypothetical protein [Actinomycetota bacterium]
MAALDVMTFAPHPAFGTPGATVATTVSCNGFQYAARCFLARRIVNATRVRWKYTQLGSALTGNYNIGIYDDSGRKIIETGSVAFTGSVNTVVARVETITATSFEAGWYFVVIGFASLAAGSVAITGAVIVNSSSVGSPNLPGVGYVAGAGGVTLPAFMNPPTTFLDLGSSGIAAVASTVPALAVSVG